MLEVIIVIGIGSSRAISTSKIMKITAIRKNRDENGNRAEISRKNPTASAGSEPAILGTRSQHANH
jgi:hypothetical protein